MKRLIIGLLSTLVILAGLAISSASAVCTGCNATTKQFCQDQSTLTFMDCVDQGHTTEYCLNEQDKAYDSCMLLMGCPQPPRVP